MSVWAFWAAAGGMTLIVVMTLLVATRRARTDLRARSDFDLAVYRDQLAEVERDLARGVLPAEEGARLRTEISRRLLDADRAGGAKTATATKGSGLALGAVIVLMGVGSIVLYDRLGIPGYPDLPIKDRLALAEERRANRPSQAEAEAATPPAPVRTDVDPAYLDLMTKLRAAVAARPDDVEGLTLLARNEAALGNIKAALDAETRLIRLKAEAATADDHARLAEMMIIAAGGFVSPEAEAELVKALSGDPTHSAARYYSGLMFAQVGRYDRTFVLWRKLLEEGPADAPWIAPIRDQMPEVAARAGVEYTLPDAPRGPGAADVAAAADMSAEDRTAMIEGMVAQLGDRLATEGGPAEDWARLITSLSVLGRKDEAKAIYAEAQSRFEGRTVELSALREAAVTAGVGE